MQMNHAPRRRPTVVKTYGAGGFLGLLSPLLAFLMARKGMNGWQQSALREMEDDAVAMARQGYHSCRLPKSAFRCSASSPTGSPTSGRTSLIEEKGPPECSRIVRGRRLRGTGRTCDQAVNGDSFRLDSRGG